MKVKRAVVFGLVVATLLVRSGASPIPPDAPVFAEQPADDFAFVGGAVTFVAAVTGLEPFSYQWQRDGVALPDAREATLTRTNLQLADAGTYVLVVSNAAGVATSRAALLTVSGQVRQNWTAHYRNPDGGNDTNPRIIVDNAGRAILLGASEGRETGFDFVTAAYNSLGVPLWVTRFNSGSNRNDFPVDLAVDAFGGVCVAGTTRGDDAHPHFSTVKYGSNGDMQWFRSYARSPDSNDELKGVATDAAGRVFVTGLSNDDGATLRYGTDGEEEWSTVFDGGSFERPQSIAVDDGGNVYVGIWEEDFSNADLWVVKYDSSGHELWRTNYDSGGNDRLVSLKLDGAGNVYIAGQIPGNGEDDASDLVVARLAPDGRFQWVTRYSGVQHSRETPLELAVDASGNSWVVFLFDIPGSGTAVQHFGVVNFSPTGERRWLATLRTPELSTIYDLKPDANGSVYITGLAYRSSSSADMATTKFDARGTRLWTVFYDDAGGSRDYGASLALGADGRLVVAGVTGLDDQETDIVLVCYEQLDSPGAPAITSAPSSVRTSPGATVRFEVEAGGAAPLRYQWYRKGTALPNATNAVLTLSEVDFEQEGLYAVVIANPFGLIRSADAVLTVLAPPEIQQQPSPQQTVYGADAFFSVIVTGGGDLTYQWRLNGLPLAGATSATLRLTRVQLQQAGDYTVEVSNGVISVLSRSARLTVNLAGNICQELTFTADGLLQNPIITSDPTGNLYIGATKYNGTNPDFLVLKYAPDGRLLWQAVYDYPGGEGDYLSAIAVDATGNVLVTGSSLQAGFPYNSDFATVKYDAAGHELWAQRYESGTGSDFATKLALDSAGNVFVIGNSERYTDGISGAAWVTLKYAPDGTEQWVVEYRGPGRHYDVPRDLVVDTAGNVLVTGSSDGATWDGQMATIKYDTLGRELWVARYEPITGGASALALDGNGNVLVAGYSNDSYGHDVVTIKYDSVGAQLWVARHHDPALLDTFARAIATDASDNVLVTGNSGGDIATFKYDANGHQLWAARFDGPRHDTLDAPRGLALDTAGNVYVNGIASGAQDGTFDLLTIKYDVVGNQAWVAHRLGVTSDPSRPSLVVPTPGNATVVGAFGTVLSTLSYCSSNAPGLPQIVSQPQSQYAVLGSNVAFAVTATGQGLRYQWFFEGTPLPGAVGPSLGLTGVTTANQGAYRVEVYNALGAIVSPEAALTVNFPPSIAIPPADSCVLSGAAARFGVLASGDAPLTYQWMFAGQPLIGATNALLILSNVQPAQAGIYTVQVANPFGRLTASARLQLTPQVQQAWASSFANVADSGASLNDEPACSALDADGNLYVAGSSLESGVINAFADVFVVKFDTNGVQQWVAHHLEASHAARWPTALALNAAREVYVTVEDSTVAAPALLKFSAAGQLLWTLSFEGIADAVALALDDNSNAYVATKSFSLHKVSPNGARLWTAAHPNASARALTLDVAGNIYVAGAAFAPAPWPGLGNDYLTVKFNPAGQEQWSRTLRSPEGGDNQAASIAVDTAGNPVVTGQYVIPSDSGEGPRLSIGTLKYDANGNLLWFANYANEHSTESPVRLKLDASDNVVVIGSSANFENGGPHWVTLKYNPAGALLWVRGVSGTWFASHFPRDLATAPSGNIYVTGTVVTESAQPMITTVKYSPAGDELWMARYQESTWTGLSYGTFAVGVHLDRIGRVLVAGAVGYNERDVIALAYTQEPTPGAPVILLQPHALVVTAGTPAIFTVVASNALTVQWQHDGILIPGATGAVLTIAAALPEESGRYSALVANETYCIESAGARLLVEAGSQPYLVPGLVRTSNGIELQFVAQPYASYILQTSSDLEHWDNAGTFYHDGGGTQTCVDTDPHPGPRRFYRMIRSQSEP
jgi:uncharacterized delta-60 repeat protein